MIVVVAALAHAVCLPAALGYSWAVSPQERFSGRQADGQQERDAHSAGADSWAFSPCSFLQAPGSSIRAKETMVSVTMGESVAYRGSLSPLPFLRYDLGVGRRVVGGRPGHRQEQL